MFIKQKITKLIIFLIFFIIFPSLPQASEDVPLNNMAINENPTPISSIKFEDLLGNGVELKDYVGKLVILNFWATWCAPCKKEMPSLDKLFQNAEFRNLQIFAINTEQPNPVKTKKFFTDLNIQKLNIFFDQNLNFVKEFKLRGVPTTILINKDGKEFARIIGETNFEDKKFVKWLLKYD